MTEHVRTLIRRAIGGRLSDIPAFLPVFVGRRYAIQPDEMPCIVVYAQSPSTEQSRVQTMGKTNRTLLRNTNVVIDIITQDADAIEDVLDGYGALVEAKLDEDVFLTQEEHIRLTHTLSLISSDHIAAAVKGANADIPIGVLRLTYEVQYVTLTGTPTVAA